MNAIELINAWFDAKQAELNATEKRHSVEKELLKLMSVKEEGRTTAMLTNTVRCIATAKLNYKADVKMLSDLTKSWPEADRPIKTVLEVDETALKRLRHDRPETWKKLALAITLKRAKTHITLEKVDGV
jgi:Rad3-related DNA helicase